MQYTELARTTFVTMMTSLKGQHAPEALLTDLSKLLDSGDLHKPGLIMKAIRDQAAKAGADAD